MRSLSVDLDEDTFEALEIERRLIGFESREAYVRWIVDQRASIADETDDAADLLEASRERIATLERRLAAEADAPSADGDRSDGQAASSVETDARDGSREIDAPGGETSAVGARDSATDTTADPDPADATATAAAGENARSRTQETRSDGDGWTRARSDPTVEVRGSPRTTISRNRPPESAGGSSAGAAVDEVESSGAGTENAEPSADETDAAGSATSESDSDVDPGRGSDAERETADDGADPEPGSETDSPSGHLTPERVVRIPGDPVSEDADVLDTVEIDRLDELSRRAVAKTRSRLNRPVETGLEYRSSTRLVDETIRPGEDVVDLESLSVPGHDDETVAARREVAGRAIAFLRDEGRARKSDFVDALYESHPAGYETADSWWACLKRALKQVDAIDGGDGRRVWQFSG